MNEKLTEWFPAKVKPTIPGVYEFRNIGAPYHYWDGNQWLHCAGHKPNDLRHGVVNGKPPMDSSITYHLRAEWRGLAENPEK